MLLAALEIFTVLRGTGIDACHGGVAEVADGILGSTRPPPLPRVSKAPTIVEHIRCHYLIETMAALQQGLS